MPGGRQIVARDARLRQLAHPLGLSSDGMSLAVARRAAVGARAAQSRNLYGIGTLVPTFVSY
jgi:hypothetical protein